EWEGHIQGARPKDGRFVDRCEGIAGVLHRVRSPQCVCLETCDNWAYESPKSYLPQGAAWGLRSMSAAYGAQTALITAARSGQWRPLPTHPPASVSDAEALL